MLKISKSLAILLVASSLSYAQEVEVFANEVVENGNITNITGGIVLEYEGDLLSGKSAIYDKSNNTIIIKDSVSYIPKSGKNIKANELKVNLNNDHIVFKDFFQIDKDDVWISSVVAKKEEEKYKFTNAIFSSCQVDNPDWLIGFDKAEYDTKDRVLRLEDAKVYVKDVPVFYFPYIYIPLNTKERRSGFLRPIYGNIENEGFLYDQPYFWAISKSQDLEINPQYRSKRGYGAFATYRFYHAKDAHGTIKAGYFKDKKSYTDRYNLKYSKHYGAEVEYTNNSLIDSLSKGEYENKLYVNGIYLSDSDYVALQADKRVSHFKVGSYYDSRLNYFVKNNYFYSGVNFRYFKSDSSVNNKNTIQILPKLNFHLPYTNVIFNNLSYIADLSLTNYTRESGSKALKLKFKAPIEMHFSFFNNYLNLNLTEEIESTAYDFYNVPLEQKKYSSIVANHKIELSSEVTKLYDSGIHTALFSLLYTKSSLINDSWMKFKEIPKELKSDFIDDIPFDSKLTFRTHQYWNSFNSNLSINYILDAHYYIKEHKLRDINQEVNIKYKNWKLYSNIGYSLLHNKTTGIYNKISYDNKRYGLALAYLWRKDYLSLETTSKDLSASGYFKYDDSLSFRAKANYNLKNSNLKGWEVGTNLNRKCWSVDFNFGQSIRPVLKRDGSRGSIKNNYFGVQLTILPFGISYAGGS